MRIFITILCILSFSKGLEAQHEEYAPDTNYLSHYPMRYVRINVHVVRNDDGTMNFSEEEGTKYVKHLVKISNNALMNNRVLNLPADHSIPNLPINYQYVLCGELDDPTDDGIYFIDDTERNDFNSLDHRNMADSRLYDAYGKRKDDVLNVFLMENNDTSDYTSRGIGMRNWVKVGSCYASLKKRNRAAWAMKGLFNHEIGHSLGLAHTWSGYDGCEDTPIHPNCWNYTESGPCMLPSNNMMDYNANQNALSPCQIGLIHMGLSWDHMPSRKFVVKRWCEYIADSTITINAGDSVSWNVPKDLEGDIWLKKKSVLVINQRINLAPGAVIRLTKSSKLFLGEKGIIKSDCGKDWGGFIVTGWKLFAKNRLRKAVSFSNEQLQNHTFSKLERKAFENKLSNETEP